MREHVDMRSWCGVISSTVNRRTLSWKSLCSERGKVLGIIRLIKFEEEKKRAAIYIPTGWYVIIDIDVNTISELVH